MERFLPPAASAQYPQRVLVVDDTLPALYTLLRVMQQRGIDADAATDGRMAWTVIGQKRPEVVITDIEMPVWTGVQLIKAIRESKDEELARLPVIVVSSVARAEIERTLAIYPRTYFLQKPVSVYEIDLLLQKIKWQDSHHG
ncbi:MAG: response regulator [Planctomycetaceae bacterium]